MTTENELDLEQRFVPRVLPWIVAAAAIVLYAVTLNHWVSVYNLTTVTKTSGWTWEPEVSNPAYFLATYPIRWLPAGWIPLALNLFSAVCAAVTLGLLARSVALLPHDRTHAQREREPNEHAILSLRLAWLPPALAAIACGLQMTFWEQATNGSNEMFDLMMFAVVIWSLLEYRIQKRESRLYWTAFVYGLGMASNWAFVGFFPVFIAALIWIQGVSFFKPRFLGRMATCGIAGLLFLLLLPLLATRSDVVNVTLWQALKVPLAAQKNIILLFPKNVLGLLALTSLLPVFVMSIRWASYFGDTSPLGVGLATFMFHLVHGVFLLACVWVAFDPSFSPRHVGFGLPFLTFYYLGALVIGYCAGYFLLIFGVQPFRQKTASGGLKTADVTVLALVFAVSVLVTAGLLYKNLPQICATNAGILKQYVSLIEQLLPPSGAVLLSDDPARLFLVQAGLARDGKESDYLLAGTQYLDYSAYHKYLHKNHPQRWPAPTTAEQTPFLKPTQILQRLISVSANSTIYYLHPSFGYYFEHFYPQPHGLVFQLQPYPTNTLMAPLPTQDQIAENTAFWKRADKEAFQNLLPLISPPKTEGNLFDQLLAGLRLKRDGNINALQAGAFYSRGLNYWGVQMQRRDDSDAAAADFETALKLNPDNVVAKINLDFNKELRSGHSAAVQISKSLEDRLGQYRSWDEVISKNGPFDEPTFCYEQGRVFLQNFLYRQAAAAFARVREFSPDNVPARIWLARLYVMAHQPDEALQVLKDFEDHPDTLSSTSTNRPDYVLAKASALLEQKDLQGAQQVLEAATFAHPDDENLLGAALRAYEERGYHSNALVLVNRRLQLVPDDPIALLNKGYVSIQLGDYDSAASSMTRLLALQTTNYAALFNRAIAYVRSGKLDAAQQDYETLEKLFPTAYPIHYGLAEIAWRRKDTNSAINHYKLYLANADTNTMEGQIVRQRLKELRGGSP